MQRTSAQSSRWIIEQSSLKAGRLASAFSRRITVLAAGAMLAACGGGDPSGPAAIRTISIKLPPFQIAAGGTYTLTVEEGGAVTTKPVTWTSSNQQVATISQSGLLTALAAGNVTVTAQSDGLTATSNINVLPFPVQTVVLTQPQTVLVQGQTLTYSAVLRDAKNNVLTGRTLTWTSSASAILAVQPNGDAVAVGPGTATLTATSEGKSAQTTVTVHGVPQITSTFSAPISAGMALVLTGQNFAADAFGNVVTFGDVTAQVSSASATQLTVSVPCVTSAGPVPIRVTRNGISSEPVSASVAFATVALMPGESSILSPEQSACLALSQAPGNARYLVTVFNSSTNLNAVSSVRLVGASPAAGAVAARVNMPALPLSMMFGSQSVANAADAAREREHMRRLEWNNSEAQRLRSIARSRPTLPAARVVAPDVGDLREFKYPGAIQNCNSTGLPVMQTKAIYVGARTIIWEDAANTLQSADNPSLATFYERMGQIYDLDQHDAVKDNFADPLIRDGLTDNDGKVHMIFSQRLNNTGAAAFVISCDQFHPSVAAASNHGQFFYGSVPTSATLNVNTTASPDGWFYFMARTVVHEVKHIASMSARVANNSPSFEQGWLEEGTARMAEEMWVRKSLHNVAWKANTGWGNAASNGIFCDFHPTNATCNAADPLRRPSYGMRRQFNEIRQKLVQPWEFSPFGEAAGQTGAVFYNTVWSLVRFAIDRHGSSDADFLGALTNSTTTGVTNLTAVAGTTIEQLLGEWGMALFADDYPGMPQTNPALQFQTWNLRSIYEGLHQVGFQNAYPNPFPIQPAQTAFGAFESDNVNIRGGAHAYYEISGNGPALQPLRVRSGTGGQLSPEIRMAIVRLQ